MKWLALMMLLTTACTARRTGTPPITGKIITEKKIVHAVETNNTVYICGANQTCTSSFPTVVTRYFVRAQDSSLCEVSRDEWVRVQLMKRHQCALALAWREQ